MNHVNVSIATGQGQCLSIWVSSYFTCRKYSFYDWYSEGLTVGLGDAITGLYTTNESAPLQAGAGLRQSYEFGLYSYCGYTTDVLGTCTNHTTARKYEPYDAITSDMRANYSQLTNFIIQGTTFKDSKYLGSNSKSAYYLLLLGTICTALALFTFVHSRAPPIRL